MIAMPLHQDPASNNVLPSPENLKRKILVCNIVALKSYRIA